MYKSITKIVGVAVMVIAIISLLFPIYRTNIEGGESWIVVLKGFNVVEFSPWGGLVVAIPLLILGIMYTQLTDNKKILLTMGMYMLGIVSLYNANCATREWIYEQATGFVYTYGSLVYYAVALSVAVVLFCLHCIINFADNNTTDVVGG